MHPASRGLLAVSSTQFAHLLWPGASSEKACEKEFTDYYDIVPDYKNPKGMGGAGRDDHPDNIQATHWWCNEEIRINENGVTNGRSVDSDD
jgi:hypothetical protein